MQTFLRMMREAGHFGGSDRVERLKILSSDEKIEALIDLVESNPDVYNFVLLGEAFEVQNCLVNVFWVLKRIIAIDPDTGRKYFNEFYRRHYSSKGQGDVSR